MRLKLYRVDPDYCDFLRKTDSLIPDIQGKKSQRPFAGILFSIEGYQYYAPLTSPKEKHKRMKNKPDFHKIDGGILGAINFNNMIPVHEDCIKQIKISFSSSDAIKDIQYKTLLQKQISWCNAHKEILMKKAEKLYSLIINDQAPEELKERCCNFKINQEQYQVYCNQKLLKL